jgi:hypothetical protein
MVVAVDEETQSTVAVREIRKHRAREKFLPQRFPESLYLPQRLRMLRPALDVPDAVAPKLLLECRLPAPHRVLPPLVRQDLLRRSVLRHRARQRLHHQFPALVMRQRPAHDETRMVIHEGTQIEPFVPAQQEGEDVRLPQLIWCRPLETPRPVLVRRRWRACLWDQPCLVQHPPHLRLRHAQPRRSCQHVCDSPRAPVRMLPP